MSDFAIWLESELRRRGLSHNEAARQAGLSQSAVSNVIADNKKPGFEFCLKVAAAFELPPVDLLILAGILPDSTPPAVLPLTLSINDNPQTKEIMDIMKSLRPAQRDKLLSYARFLKQGGD